MPPRLRLNPEAEADLVEAFAWYEGQRPGLGSEFFAEVAQVLQRIEDTPLQHAVVQEDTRRAIVRRFPYAVFLHRGSRRHCCHGRHAREAGS